MEIKRLERSGEIRRTRELEREREREAEVESPPL